MVTLTRPERLNPPLAPAVAAAAGGLLALAMLIMPAALLERLVVASGIPAVLAAAEPPLGFTARIALGVILGGGLAGFVWVGLKLLGGERGWTVGSAAALLRRGDVHPDAPPRPPLFAHRDLGTPFLDVKAPATGSRHLDADDPVVLGRQVPIDLDQPLAAYDPDALLDVPLPAPEPVAPLAVPIHPPVALPRPSLIDPGDRFETFEITPVARSVPLSLRVPPAHSLRATSLRDTAPARPMVAAVPDRVVGPETEATVHDLLARLERGISAKPPQSKSGLADTLGDLRRLATGAR